MRPNKVLVIFAIVAGATASTAAQPPEKLTPDLQAVFCGEEGHEITSSYGTAVNREISWRMLAGARTPAEALAQMRTEYCHRNGGAK